MFEAGLVKVGDRVTTPKGEGRITKISVDDSWVGGDLIRESLVVVQLDGREPTGMRPVFYASQVKPIGGEVDVEVVLEDDAG